MANLYTHEGMEAVRNMQLSNVARDVAIGIIEKLDHELSNTREILRQYRQCYGGTHDWYNATSERIRIAKQVLEEAEENYQLLKHHNL